MGRAFGRRSLRVAAIAVLVVAGLAIPADAERLRVAAASTGRVDDPTGDGLGTRPVPVHEPRADLTSARAVALGDGRIELTASVASPTDPATDAGWNEGRSYVIWGLDTTSDGAADYMVWMASNPPLAAVVVGDRLNAVDGCNPVADYTPARYSVTFSGSCIANPATFKWNAIVYYDMSHNGDGDGATDFFLGSDDELALTPGTQSDPTGDVISRREANDPRADITSATVTYEPGRIVLTATVAQPTDPRVDPAWVAGLNEVNWYVDLNGDEDADYIVNLHDPDLTARTWSLNDENAERCTNVATYSSAAYTVTIDPECVGNPVSFHWGVSTFYEDFRQAAIDTAPDDTFAGPVTAPPGTGFDPPTRPAGGQSGYWMITDSGDVYGFGTARDLGHDEHIRAAHVDIEPTPSGGGYWILATNGSVTARGDARNLGDAALRKLQRNEYATAISATPTGDGYWIFTNHGRALPYGNAVHLGDMAGTHLNGAVLDAVVTPTGRGYWMVGEDGGIFSFGDATFSGSTGNLKLNKPVMSMAADPDGRGYWLVASDGGIFAFDAPFHGSMGATKLNKPISGIVPGDAGYLMVGEDGGIFAFGTVAFHGSLGANPPASPVVAVALSPIGN